MKTTRRVLRTRGPQPCLDTLMSYKRDPSHSTNEHINHVVNMFKCLEGKYILQLDRKKANFTNVINEPEKKVLENIWESIQEGPHVLTYRSFDDLIALFK